MPSNSTVILGTGSYAPDRILTNGELAQTVDTSDEWILTRSGIRERRIAAAGEETSDMAAKAGRRAMDDAGVGPDEVDLLIVATFTPDLTLPSSACIVQNKLGLRASTASFDLNAACSGFIYALDTACAMLTSGRYNRALVIGAEKMSAVVNWSDRTTCVLFGDGAGAVVVGCAALPGRGLIGTKLGALGDSVDLLCIPSGGSSAPPSADSVAAGGHFVKMRGREVFKMAVRGMEEISRDILEQHHIAPAHIALVIPHQANLRIIEALAQYLDLPIERFFVNLDRYGNTSAASIPMALDEARRAGRIKAGDLILLVAFGAGLTYGSALIRW
jgi:3-oxoacyl-[acyl-carrier-protein] synthase-3